MSAFGVANEAMLVPPAQGSGGTGPSLPGGGAALALPGNATNAPSGLLAPMNAKQASDWAAGPQAQLPVAAAKTADFNESIASNAIDYEVLHGQVPYLYGGNSTAGIDCSHYVNHVLGVTDPNYDPVRDYQSTSVLNDEPPDFYEPVDAGDVQRGDIVLFDGHMGIVTKPIDPLTGQGEYIGSQSSTGVATTAFGPKAPYWGKTGGREVTGYLRYKGKGDAAGQSATKGSSANAAAGEANGASSENENDGGTPTAAEVTNNDREIATQGSNHQATTQQPTDAHPGSVKQFMNFASSSLLQGGSVLTKIKGASIWLQDTGCLGPTEPSHDDHQPGLITGTYRAVARAVKASRDCFVEGQAVVREGDETEQNGGNASGVVEKAPPPAADSDRMILAAIIYHEASDYDPARAAGMTKEQAEAYRKRVEQERLAVGSVVRNRRDFAKANPKLFGSGKDWGDGESIASVVQAPGQFEKIDSPNSKYRTFLNGDVPAEKRDELLAVADRVLAWETPANIGYYENWPTTREWPEDAPSTPYPFIDFLSAKAPFTGRTGRDRTDYVQIGNTVFRGLLHRNEIWRPRGGN
ncbi:NlpC/P60 family protein [Chondromyces crocatus]|nr:NlpC/P60 family protein [Chondromyces crocatus]